MDEEEEVIPRLAPGTNIKPPKECGHEECHLFQPTCCECIDKRPEPSIPAPGAGSSHEGDTAEAMEPEPPQKRRTGYMKYVDGVGFQPSAVREEWYCQHCKDRLGFEPDLPHVDYVPIDYNEVPDQSPISEMFMRIYRLRQQREEEEERRRRENEESDPALNWNPHAHLPAEIPEDEWFCPHSAEWTDCRACIPDESEIRELEKMEGQVKKMLVHLGHKDAEADKLVRLAGILRRRREEERRLRYWRAQRARAEGRARQPRASEENEEDGWSPEAVVAWIVGTGGNGGSFERYRPSNSADVVHEINEIEDRDSHEPSTGQPSDFPQASTEPRPTQTPTQDECRICLSRPINSLIIPCGHLALCLPCANRLLPQRNMGRERMIQQLLAEGQPFVPGYALEEEEMMDGVRGCPICRAPVERVVQVFRV